jgi:VIT1/CCC1 family predicted Fe2+/Mn2+ transporter
MLNNLKNRNRLKQTKFSFGATSAIITNLALITGLDTLTHPKLSIIGGILAIALADNISDSVGIHIFQESECISNKEVWVSTFTNFLTRLLVSLTFIILVGVLPIELAVVLSTIWGLMLLVIMSYTIARDRGSNPYLVILEHISIAILVITASHIVGKFVISRFKGKLV